MRYFFSDFFRCKTVTFHFSEFFYCFTAKKILQRSKEESIIIGGGRTTTGDPSPSPPHPHLTRSHPSILTTHHGRQTPQLSPCAEHGCLFSPIQRPSPYPCRVVASSVLFAVVVR